jgi:hypothetical protein
VSRYWYLASALPGLLFGAPPPLGSGDFLGFCKRLMNPKDYLETEAVPRYLQGEIPAEIRSGFLESFLIWERGFKNELSRLRARGSGKNEDAYIRKGRQSDEAVKAAATCFAVDDPLKAELSLEKERWAAVERLSALSGFDLDFIIAYRIKLMINERLQNLAAEAGKNSYRRLYTEIFGAAEQEAATDTSGERA